MCIAGRNIFLNSRAEPANYAASSINTWCKVMTCEMQEICSFLKGSSEALESPGGKLKLEAYLEVYD